MAKYNNRRDANREDDKSTKGKQSGGRNNNNRSNKSNKQNGNKNSEGGAQVVSMSTQLAYDVASFPFSGAVGREIDAMDNASAGIVSTAKFTAPGVCAIELFPTIGDASSPRSAINLAMKNLFSFVTHANSRNPGYEATDMMVYVLATTNLFSLWRHAARAYGVARNFTVLNKYTPNTLVRAMGFDYDDLMMNLNDFRGSLNLLASKLSSIVVPSSISYIQRQFNLFASVYADSENSRAQLYVLKPSAYWEFNEAAYETGSACRFHVMDEIYTTKQYVNLLNTLADSILNSSYMNIIAADIIKAYDDKLYTLTEISEDYYVFPVYSDEVLETISNLVVLGMPDTDPSTELSSGDVRQVIPESPQSAPFLVSAPIIVNDSSQVRNRVGAASQLKIHLNTNYETLSPAQVIDRLAFSGYPKYFTSQYFRLHTRTEGVSSVKYYLSPESTSAGASINYPVYANTDLTGLIEEMTQFNKFPIIPVLSTDYTSLLTMFGTIDNVAWYSQNDYDNMREAVLQMELGISI